MARNIPAQEDVGQQAWLARWKAAYEDWCGRWFAFGARGGTDPKFLGFLGKFREYLTNEYIPVKEQAHAGQKKFFDAMGIPVSNYVTPVAKEAVAIFLDEAAQVFGGRSNPPISP
jgi:hypothetical protein